MTHKPTRAARKEPQQGRQLGAPPKYTVQRVAIRHTQRSEELASARRRSCSDAPCTRHCSSVLASRFAAPPAPAPTFSGGQRGGSAQRRGAAARDAHPIRAEKLRSTKEPLLAGGCCGHTLSPPHNDDHLFDSHPSSALASSSSLAAHTLSRTAQFGTAQPSPAR